jgi:hypothetical protein
MQEMKTQIYHSFKGLAVKMAISAAFAARRNQQQKQRSPAMTMPPRVVASFFAATAATPRPLVETAIVNLDAVVARGRQVDPPPPREGEDGFCW